VGRRVVAIANPAAGLRRRGDPARKAIEAFRRVDPRARVDVIHTERPGDAKRIAARAASTGADLVLAVGGDGTAHEAANGLLGTRTALGVIPAGTMNLLARVLGLPIDPEAAARRLALSAHFREVRPGRAGETAFLLMAGVGFDAWVLRELLAAVRGKIRFRDYVRGALAGLRTYPFPSLRVQLRDEAIECHSAVIGRAPLYGGFLRPTPRADLSRDRFEVCALSGGRGTLARALAAMGTGAHSAREGARFRFAVEVEIEVEAPGAPIPFQLDGEPGGTLPARFEIARETLRLAALTPSPPASTLGPSPPEDRS
jgi:YegS/Rv2252/BmrU family lipid kinase